MSKKTKRIRIAPGICPKCGSKELEGGTLTLVGQTLGHNWDCKDCKASGIELSNVKFFAHAIPKPDEPNESEYFSAK
jgi:predicted nucleic-acid-binding Zn-ribbon protein